MDLCLDTSTIVAIAFQEATAPALEVAINDAKHSYIGAATLFETCLVTSRRAEQDAEGRVMELIASLGVEVMPLDVLQVGLAQRAFIQFGKGRHPARLNFGDCLAYAAAKSRGVRLLYVGDDFTQTDLA